MTRRLWVQRQALVGAMRAGDADVAYAAARQLAHVLLVPSRRRTGVTAGITRGITRGSSGGRRAGGPRRVPVKHKLRRAVQVLQDVATVTADAAAWNAAHPGAPVDPDPDATFPRLRRNAQVRVDSEVWRTRARRPAIR